MAASVPFRSFPTGRVRTPTGQNAVDPYDQVNHYIGIDVGTGSARACIISEDGDIVGLASENIALWQPQAGYYVCFLRTWEILL